MTDIKWKEDLLGDGMNNALITTSDYLKWMTFLTRGQFKYTQLKERIMSAEVGFVFHVNHFFFKAYNRKMTQMVEGGLFEFYKAHADSSKIPVIMKSDERITLTMDHIGVWFVIWSVGLSVAILCFLIELTALKIWKLFANKFRKVCNFRSVRTSTIFCLLSAIHGQQPQSTTANNQAS